jgi:hypothetical protein
MKVNKIAVGDLLLIPSGINVLDFAGQTTEEIETDVEDYVCKTFADVYKPSDKSAIGTMKHPVIVEIEEGGSFKELLDIVHADGGLLLDAFGLIALRKENSFLLMRSMPESGHRLIGLDLNDNEGEGDEKDTADPEGMYPMGYYVRNEAGNDVEFKWSYLKQSSFSPGTRVLYWKD